MAKGLAIVLSDYNRAIRPNWAFMPHESTEDAIKRGVPITKCPSYEGRVERYIQRRLYGDLRPKSEMA